MKHSIRYIQVNYSRMTGFSINILRGMEEIRAYKYSSKRFMSILDGLQGNFESIYKDTEISFTRIYKES